MPETQILGESERFLGANDWRDFDFAFRVADSCKLQEIRLVSAGKHPRASRITGDAWFDRIAIHKNLEPAKACNTETLPKTQNKVKWGT